ncbi:ligand-gated channel protein [Pseudoroseomonas deserti]|uniref:Ligand-gated channel protein n=1 Tax=Teichococcus deserti TaxID=1817963 RepID=A0A1V2GYX6_9PROT|nr:TonB-dependent siderophore receptor [Pseudoroseomonas deserti]ONG50121.1 ligand-gated channel protein [Pseudoroseomonas deserti]
MRPTSLAARHALAWLLATTCLAAPAFAQAPAAAETAQALRRFDIPSQPLPAALAAFGLQSGLQVSYPSALDAGATAPGVSGVMTPEEGLRRLLSGSGLTWRFAGPGTVTLVPLPRPAADGAMALPQVDVQAAASRGYSPVVGMVAPLSATASKTDTPLSEIPQSISVVPRAQLEQQNVQSISEALRYVPGVAIESYGVDPKGFDWILLRGFNAQGTSDYRDGLRQANNSYSFFRSEPYALERIEILRGPASVLYGQADAGGIVNRVSKRPSATPAREVLIQAGNNNRLQAAVDATGPLDQDGHFLYRLVGVVRRSDTGFAYGNGQEVGDDRIYIAPSLTWAPDSSTSVTLFADYLRDESGGTINLITRGARPSRNLVGDPNFDLFSQKQFNIGYQFEHRFNSTLTLRQNLRYAEVDVLLNNLQLLALGADGRTYSRYARRFDEHLSQFSVDTQLQADFTTGPVAHTLLGGVDYYRTAGRVRRSIGTAPSLDRLNPVYGVSIAYPTLPQVDYNSWYDQLGLYLQDQARIDRWIFTLGGRFDSYSSDTHNELARTRTSQDDTTFTGRAGISYAAPWGVTPYVSYSESFVPNSGISSPATGSRPFEPSFGRQWEAGVKYQPDGMDALLTAAVFDIVKSNVLTTDLRSAGFSVAEGEVRSRGLELEGRASLVRGLDLLASYTYTDAEVTRSNSGTAGKEPTLVPRHMASAWAHYRVPGGVLESLSLGAGIRYIGATWGDQANTLRVAAHTLLDLALGYEIGRARLQLTATNLTDERVISTCGAQDACYLAAGRTVIAGVRYRF